MQTKLAWHRDALFVARTSKQLCMRAQGYTHFKDVPLANIKRITAQRLLESKQTIPHYYLTIDCKVDKLVALRHQLNEALAAGQGGKLSVNDFVIKAAALVSRSPTPLNAKDWMYVCKYLVCMYGCKYLLLVKSNCWTTVNLMPLMVYLKVLVGVEIHHYIQCSASGPTSRPLLSTATILCSGVCHCHASCGHPLTLALCCPPQALRKVPQVNASWRGDYIREFLDVNIGVAVQTDVGLLVPVLPAADAKGLGEISKNVKELAGKVGTQPQPCSAGLLYIGNAYSTTHKP